MNVQTRAVSSIARYFKALLIATVAIVGCVSAPAVCRAQGTAPAPRANPEASIALQDRFQEFMQIVNGDFDRLRPELFTASFREQLPLGPFTESIKEQYAQRKGFKLLASNAMSPYEIGAWVRTVSDGKDWDLLLGIEAQRPYAINSLVLQARPDKSQRAFDGWGLLDRDLEAIIDRSGFAIYEILPDGSMKAVHRVYGDRRMAIGLGAQLWLLAGVAEKVARGDATWDQTVSLQGNLKSLPLLGFAVTPNGTEFQLHEFTTRLMTNQDTTAFDHLLDFLGSQGAEAVRNSFRQGPDGPGSVVGSAASPEDPFLSTLDLYRLTCTADATLIKTYSADSPAERRTMLKTALANLSVMYELFEVWAKPQYLESVGWFATPDELCRAAARVWTLGQKPEMSKYTLDAMEAADNPLIDREAFKYVGVSTGGVPGAFAGTWIYERVDGRVYVMTFIFNNANRLLNTQQITPIIEASQALVGVMKDPPAKP